MKRQSLISAIILIIIGCSCSNNHSNTAIFNNRHPHVGIGQYNLLNKDMPDTTRCTMSIDQIWEYLNKRYSESSDSCEDSMAILMMDYQFPLYKDSPIDSCKISYCTGGDPGVFINIFLSKSGSMMQLDDFFYECFDDDFTSKVIENVIALIPLPYTAAIYEYLDRIYISKTAGARVSSNEKRGSNGLDSFMDISIYSGKKVISNRFFVDGPRFFDGPIYDYSYEMTNVITIVNQLVYEYMKKIGLDYSIFEDSDFKIIRNE